MSERLRKYLVGRLAHQFAHECGSKSPINTFFVDGSQVEHIFPQRPEAKNFKDFGIPVNTDPEVVETYIHALGNLTLLGPSENPSAGRLRFAEKRDGFYKKSKYELSRSLAVDLSVGKDTMPKKAVAKYGLRPVAAWTPAQLASRSRSLATLVAETWPQAPAPPTGWKWAGE
jgi:hypothetical protein